MKVLIVDDNTAVQEILKDILTENGYMVHVAGNVAEAVSKVGDFRPDVVVIETWVGNTDGMRVINRCRDENPGVPLNVVLIKGVSEQAPTDNPLIKGYIDKPFTSEDVIGVLHDVSLDLVDEQDVSKRRKRRKLFFQKRKAEPEPPVEDLDEVGMVFGTSYVVFEQEPDGVYRFIDAFLNDGCTLAVVTSERGKSFKERFSGKDIEVVTLSANARAGALDIRGLGTLTFRLNMFSSTSRRPVVIIDNFRDLVEADGLGNVLIMLHELVSTHADVATFVVSVDPSLLTEKDRRIILHDMRKYYNHRGEQMQIDRVWAREVLDSRGNPTVEAEVTAAGRRITAIAPSGASTGTWEAHELRDGGGRFGGKGVLNAVENIRGEIAGRIVGMDPTDQEGIDQAMIELDGTENKSRLGGNAIVAVSLAVAKAGAACSGMDVYEYIGDDHVTLPVPMLNIINGGKHAGGNLKIQECMVIPAGARSFSDCLRMSAEVYAHLKSILKQKYGVGAINIGDEGGFAPPLDTVDEALETIVSAVSDAGYVPGKDVFLAIDAASSEFFKDGVYSVDGRDFSPGELVDHYVDLVRAHPLISIEDPFFEDDFETTAELTEKIGDRVQIVGDDLYVTNTKRLSRGIGMDATNALLLKVNQIGTVSESAAAARMCFDHGYNVVVSHRSGESEDTTIADLSVGWGAGEIKTGAPARGERTAKYNRLLRIEEDLGSKAVFPGIGQFKK